MANIVLNGNTASGLPNGTGNQNLWQPTGITLSERKIGVTLPSANGTRNRVERNVVKQTWEITWKSTNGATVNTLRAIQRLMTAWTFTDIDAASWQCQTEDDDFAPEWAFISRAGVMYWNVTLKIFQV